MKTNDRDIDDATVDLLRQWVVPARKQASLRKHCQNSVFDVQTTEPPRIEADIPMPKPGSGRGAYAAALARMSVGDSFSVAKHKYEALRSAMRRCHHDTSARFAIRGAGSDSEVRIWRTA